MGGGRGQKDKVPSPLTHSRHKSTSTVKSCHDVALKHRAPPCRIYLGDSINTDSSAGVIYQRVDGAALQDARSHLFYLRLIAKISCPKLTTNLIGKGLQALAASGYGNDLPSMFSQKTGGCFPDSTGSSCDNDTARGTHGVTVISPGAHRLRAARGYSLNLSLREGRRPCEAAKSGERHSHPLQYGSASGRFRYRTLQARH